MIAHITGQLESLADDRAVVAAGAVAYEVLLAPTTADGLRPHLGRTVTLHTLQYFDGNPAYGQMAPRLVGFLTETEKRFFMLYVSVQGIGIGKGLKSLAIPVERIAAAIEAGDAATLAGLPGIGRRTAAKIVAELAGRLDEFAVPAGAGGAEQPESKQEAISVLMSLGLARPEAADRVDAAYQRLGADAEVEAIVREAFHQGPTPAEG
ncbi:MAG: Holliday junction branch migration protein RuvA [Phycisphaerae bacterium]